MSNFVEIDKIEAARRHLVAGISLFFAQVDPIAVHTVAWASYQTLSDICKHRKITREIEDSAILKELGIDREFIKAFRKPNNFFKHADKDPDGTVKFFPDMSYLILMMASEYYAKITGAVPGESQVLRAWFALKHPDHVPAEWKTAIQRMSHIPDIDDFELFRLMLKAAANNSFKPSPLRGLGAGAQD